MSNLINEEILLLNSEVVFVFEAIELFEFVRGKALGDRPDLLLQLKKFLDYGIITS